MKYLLNTASLCAVLVLPGLPIIAATPSQLQQAQELLSAEQPAQALGLLQAAHDPSTASTQEFFLLGIAAKQAGQLAESEGYFRSALQSEPSAGRIRLELAEVLYRQGKLDDSRAELVAVRAMNPPEQVRQNIDGFIAQVDQARANPNAGPRGPQKNWSAYITAGLTSDSNVNAGPDTDTVFLYGLPFTLSSAAQETQDTAFFVRTGINHQVQLDNGILWRSSANLSFSNYFEANAYDTTSFFVSTGPSFKLSDQLGLSVPITYDVQRYNEQGSWYSQSWGIAPRLQYAARPDLQFYLDTSVARKSFNGNSDRDLTAYTFNPSVNFQPHENGNIAVGFQYGREDSGLDIYSNSVLGVYVGYQHVFREQGLRASVTASYTSTEFDGIQAAYTEAREDVSRKISASLAYTIPEMDGLSLLGSVSYQDNDSNLDINNYGRTLFSLSVTRKF
jgi:tetratricopeptide (TPR) repeat protein